MRTPLLIIALLLGSAIALKSQDFYMPVSTTSEEAKKAYRAASYLGSNIRFEAASMEIAKALEADPNYFMAYVYAYQVLAPADQKEVVLDKALAIDPSNFTEAENILRKQMLAWKADPKARPGEAMKALVAAYPTTVEAYEWAYLHAMFTEGDLDAAYDYASKLIELDPYFPAVYNGLGYLYLRKNEMDKARAAFEMYLELAPAEPNAHDSMGEYYMLTEDYAKAAAYYDQAVALGMKASKAGAEKARAAMEAAGN